MPTGSCARISSIDAVHGRIAENTCCSRIRRAISCVYCPPKSRTTIPCLVLNCPPRDRHARLPFLGRVALFVSPLDRHRERLDPPFRLCVADLALLLAPHKRQKSTLTVDDFSLHQQLLAPLGGPV